MDTIKRKLQSIIMSNLKPNKVCIILGARRVGKTVLIKEILKDFDKKYLYLNGEDSTTQNLLKERSISNYKNLLNDIDLLVIDEAQNINEIGNILKLMVDEITGIKIIATGSSAFDILNLFGEPLTGRSNVFHLYPFAQSELNSIENIIETKQKLEERLIYGSYPELLQIQSFDEKKIYLQSIVNTYLLKDILAIEGLRSSSKMYDLLKLLAYQTGKEVSYNELGNQLGISKNTVEKYLDLLSKVYIIYQLPGYSNNLRKEIRKTRKWFFFDNGIRNAIISNFSPLSLRQDIGDLWENYLLSERIKTNSYSRRIVNYYFWRTYDQQEIDFIEETDGDLSAYEFKWGKKVSSIPKAFKEAYSEAKFEIINQDNYLKWINYKD